MKLGLHVGYWGLGLSADDQLGLVQEADLVSTIYHCLGIDTAKEIHDRLARPFTVVPGGEVIRELLA